MHQRLHWVLLLGAIYTCSAIPAQRYTITDLGTMGLDTAQATGIDAKGTVVGFAETSRLFGKYEVRPFIYTDGSMVNLHDTILRALPKACHFDNQLHPTITDSGLVRGWADCGGFLGYSRTLAIFSYRDGTVDFETVRVGRHLNRDPPVRNAHDQYVETPGEYPTCCHAVLYNGETTQDLGTLGGRWSKAFGINNHAVIVGYSDTGKDVHAFIWEKGIIKDLNDLVVGPDAQFVTLGSAHGINDAGLIAADGRDSRHTGLNVGSRAYLLTPAEGPGGAIN